MDTIVIILGYIALITILPTVTIIGSVKLVRLFGLYSDELMIAKMKSCRTTAGIDYLISILENRKNEILKEKGLK